MINVAIIPARKGSKSILNKNLIKLNKKETLVERTIRIANRTRLFEEVILTTDIPLYLEGDWGCSVHNRDPSLCEDESLMIDVVREVIKDYKLDDEVWVWLLQPTTPFRMPKHFKGIQKLIHKKNDAKGVISVQSVGAFHPDRMYTKKDGKIYRMTYTSFKNKQDLMDIYIRNGAFYAMKVSQLKSESGFNCKPCYSYVMDCTESVNIDSPWDLMIAREIVRRSNGTI